MVVHLLRPSGTLMGFRDEELVMLRESHMEPIEYRTHT